MPTPAFSQWTAVVQWDVTETTDDTDNLTTVHFLKFQEVGGVKKVMIISPSKPWATGVSYQALKTDTTDPDPVDQVSGTLSDGRSFIIKRWIHLTPPELRCEIYPVGKAAKKGTPGVSTNPGTWMAQDGSGGSGGGEG